MVHEIFEPQLDWDAEKLRGAWPTSPDNFFVMWWQLRQLRLPERAPERLLYRDGRALRLLPRDQHLFWGTPVPFEHTFECTPARLQQLCAPYLELDHAFGLSLGWGVPGWGAFLARLPKARALAVLSRLDRVARRRPGLADFVISVWQPRPAAERAPRAMH